LKTNHIALISIVAVLFVISFSSIQVSNSELTYNMLVSVKPQYDPIMQGAFPIIVGNVTNEAYKPVANANVLIIFGSEAVTTTTDSQGHFKYKSAIPATPGTFEIDVTVTKQGYVKQLATSIYTVNPYANTKTTPANTTTSITNLISGMPVIVGNYTVYLGKVTQWNLETTCFVDFSTKYVRFLKSCDLYNLDPKDFTTDQKIMPVVTVIQYNNTYRLFPDNVYNVAYYLGNDTAENYVAKTWQNYTAPN
jgi:hypothetical protein